MYLTHDQYMCVWQDEKAQEEKSEENGEEIGFRTFCRLCEGIIEDFETVSG